MLHKHMKVQLKNAPEEAERLVAMAARGDHMNDSLVGYDRTDDEDMAAVMEGYSGEGTVDEQVRHLIEQLIRRGHWGVFEHIQQTFAIEGVSRVCMAQVTRHRHATWDVRSMRYTDFSDPDFHTPEKASDVKLAGGYTGGDFLEDAYEMSVKDYQHLVDEGVDYEDARMVLPLATKTNMTASMNLRTLMHIKDLRDSGKAQGEARVLAQKLWEAAKEVAPVVCEEYEEHRTNPSLRAP